MSKLAFRAQTVDIAYLPLHQDFLAKNVLMTAQRDFCFGNSLIGLDSASSECELKKLARFSLDYLVVFKGCGKLCSIQ